MAAFEAALAIGAGIECDVRLSGDGEVMVFHDHDLRRLCASGLAVEANAADVLARQRLYDTNQHIPRLTDLLQRIAGRVPLLIELKCRSGNAARLAEAVAKALGDYSGRAAVMSFEPKAIHWFARARPEQRRGLVISERASALDRWNGIRKSTPHFLAVDRAALSRPWVARERVRRHLYSWTIRSAADRATAQVHADALIWEGHGRPGA
jgi:glycerophosphoryl diester phosphodiesterase